MSELHYELDLLTAMNQKLAGNERMYRMICGMSSSAFIYYNFNIFCLYFKCTRSSHFQA